MTKVKRGNVVKQTKGGLTLEVQAKEFLSDLNLIRGAVGRSDLVSIGEGAVRGSDGVWWTHIQRDVYQTEKSFNLSYMKLLEVVRACQGDDTVMLVQKKSKCVVKSKGAGWLLNIRSDQAVEISDIEGEEKRASIPSLLDSYLGLKHLIKLDLSRPGLMFGEVSNEMLAIGDGARLGIVDCYCSSTDFPLVVLQELVRIIKDCGEQDLTWAEDDEHFDFSAGVIRFMARKLEGGFEREWRETVETEIESTLSEFLAPKSALLAAVNQTLVVSEDLVKLTQRDGENLVIEALSEGGEKAVSRVELVEASGTFDSVVISGLDLRDALQAKKDPSAVIFVCEKYVVVKDTCGLEVLCRRVV